MKRIATLISTMFLLVSCTDQKHLNEITIEGQVENLPDGIVYLTEAHHWQTPLDSTMSTKGHFVFNIKADSSFVPYMVSISYPDSSSPTKISQLAFSNDFLLPPDTTRFYNYYFNAFYLEKRKTVIKTQKRIKQKFPHGIPVVIKTGKETALMYKNQFSDFGWLGNIDSAKRLQRIAFFKKEIKKYPFSYFLLQSIYDAKEQYSEKEINEMLSLFNADVQQSKLGNQFRTYLTNRIDSNASFPNLFLLNAANRRTPIIDTNAKLTMLVFLASWCGPCRKEIPILKEIEKKYDNKGLNLTSISIDDNKDNWLQALNEEKMLWTQYIVDKDSIDLVKQYFNFAAIPLVVFTDKAGKEIKRFTGYEQEQKKNYETVIDVFLK